MFGTRVCVCVCVCVCVPCMLLPPCNPSLAWTRHFEEKQLKGQQEKAQKQLEFSNQESRLKNQLEYELKRDTSGTCPCDV